MWNFTYNSQLQICQLSSSCDWQFTSPPSLPLLDLTLSALSSLAPSFLYRSGILSTIIYSPFFPSLLPVSILLSFPLIRLTFFPLSSLRLSQLTQAKVLPGGLFRGLQNYVVEGQGHKKSALWSEEKWQQGYLCARRRRKVYVRQTPVDDSKTFGSDLRQMNMQQTKKTNFFLVS